MEKQLSEKRPSALRRAVSIFVKYGIPLIISVGLCVVLFTQVDFKENIAIIKRYCDYWWIALALVISIFSHIFRAMRWQIQLRALGIRVPLFEVVLSIFGTYAVNLVLPRLGEVWRTGYISNISGSPFTTVFGSMLSDRLADTITVALLTLVTFALASSQLLQVTDFTAIRSLALNPWLWTAVGVVIIGAWLVLTRMPQLKIVQKIRSMWSNLWSGFIVILTMKGKGRWLLLTLAVWGCYFTQLYVTFYAFAFTTQVLSDYGVIAALVCFVLSSISMVLPSNGGYGPWQWAIILGLGLYSAGIVIPEGTTYTDMSAAMANCVMTSQTLLLIALGIFTFACITILKRRQRRAAA